MSLFGRKERRRAERLQARVDDLEEQLGDKEKAFAGSQQGLYIEQLANELLRKRNRELSRRMRESTAATSVEEEAVGEFGRRLDRALVYVARLLAEVWQLRTDRYRLSMELDETKAELERANEVAEGLREELKDSAKAQPSAPPPAPDVLREKARADELARRLEGLQAINMRCRCGNNREVKA